MLGYLHYGTGAGAGVVATTTHEGIANAIRARFKALIASPNSIKVKYDNFLRVVDKNGTEWDQPQDEIWAKVEVHEADSRQVALGNQKGFRTAGVMLARLYGPLGLGDKTLRVLADKIVSNFRCVTENSIVWRSPSIRIFGRIEGWWMVNVSCPWYRDTLT